MKYCAALIVAIMLAAQAAAPEVEITAEPHHHLVLENKFVRVFDFQVDPNTETLMHWHRHDYVAVALTPGEILNSVAGKAPASVKFQPGDTGFSAATFAHAVRCTGNHPFRNLTIEILNDDALRRTPSPWDPKLNEDRALNIFNGGSQQILFVKDAIRVSEFELQPGATVPMHHHKGPHLFVAVNDLDLRSDAKGLAPIPTHFNAGDTKWLPGNYSHSLTNTGTRSAKFVALEFP